MLQAHNMMAEHSYAVCLLCGNMSMLQAAHPISAHLSSVLHCVSTRCVCHKSSCLLCRADMMDQTTGDYIEWPSDDSLDIAIGMAQITATTPTQP